MTDDVLDPQIEEAEQRGFARGLNVGLVSIGVLAALSAVWRSFSDLPQFEEVFRQVKVPMPGLTMLVLQIYKPVGLFLIIAAVVSIWATLKRGRERTTIVLNAVLFGSSLLWFAMVVVSVYLPLLSLLEGIGQRR